MNNIDVTRLKNLNTSSQNGKKKKENKQRRNKFSIENRKPFRKAVKGTF